MRDELYDIYQASMEAIARTPLVLPSDIRSQDHLGFDSQKNLAYEFS